MSLYNLLDTDSTKRNSTTKMPIRPYLYATMFIKTVVEIFKFSQLDNFVNESKLLTKILK